MKCGVHPAKLKFWFGLQQLNFIISTADGYSCEVVIISLLIHAVCLLSTFSSSHWLQYYVHLSKVPAPFMKTQYYSSFMLPSKRCQPLVYLVVKRVASLTEKWGWVIDIHDHFKFFVQDQLPEDIWNILCCFLSSFTQALLFVWKRWRGFEFSSFVYLNSKDRCSLWIA